ncbi:MAG TPA: hypothetical protein VFW19_15055 [Allosphingosinicella sp.]|nr:hypothetical protein [Allosphingosinicella sp.]
MSGLVTGVGLKLALGGLAGRLKQAAAWLFLHPAWLVAIGCALFGLIELGEARHAKKQAANYESLYRGEQAAHAVTKASLQRADGAIADNNRRIDAAHDALARAQAQAAADQTRNAKRAQATDARIAALRARAADPNRAPCTVSDEAKQALEKL